MEEKRKDDHLAILSFFYIAQGTDHSVSKIKRPHKYLWSRFLVIPPGLGFLNLGGLC